MFLSQRPTEIETKSGFKTNEKVRFNKSGDTQKSSLQPLKGKGGVDEDYKQGGACLIVTNRWASRIMKHGSNHQSGGYGPRSGENTKRR